MLSPRGAEVWRKSRLVEALGLGRRREESNAQVGAEHWWSKVSGHHRDTKIAFWCNAGIRELIWFEGVRMEPTIGLEPMTCRLRIGCSTN